ncbi:MAG: FKBP-type peptidyl-prolyl cis-trans isomerase [Methanobacteriota archaeon]|nr:MAG: FKBP-type peptidyl-prolyl cis-trans isomerase [Euryarchaeota archaeon]
MEKPPKDRGRMLLVVVAVALVLSASAIGYVLYDNSLAHKASTPAVVEMNDGVVLDYTGRFSDGRVFDTSILEVAEDDVLYPKSLTFTMRDNTSYQPFNMVAGLYGEEGGTIKGFALGVIGLSAGDTKIIDVAPEDAYAVNPEQLETVPLEEHVVGTETMDDDEFSGLFKVDPVVMDHAPHYKWGWDVIVTEIDFGIVTFKHSPTVGEVVYPFGDPHDDDPMGWACVVESFDPEINDGAGEVVVRHEVSEDDVYAFLGETFEGEEFVISSFDSENETFEIHKSRPDVGYNAEIAGRALFFEVTIISVTKKT